MSELTTYLNQLVGDSSSFAKEELSSIISAAKGDSKVFIKHMGELTEEFIKMRALGEINNDELKELIADLVDLNKLQYHKLSTEAKVRASEIAQGISQSVNQKLLAAIA